MAEPPISPAQQSKIRRLAQPAAPAPDEAGGELNIVPFLDIIMNVLMFVLATLPAVFTATALVDPPKRPNPGDLREIKPTLQLTLVVADEGVSFKTAGHAVGAGCEVGGGLVAPRSSAGHDWAAVKACARKLKGASPDFEAETEVAITASNGTPYSDVVAAMDAVRQDSHGPLFPGVRFAVVR